MSIATRVGQIVFSPCFSYHSARSGSRIRAITVGTLKRRFAICAITMLVLSPSVEAMNASACSIPAASSASISSPVPTVNWPPSSSHERSSVDLEPRVRLGVLVEAGDLVPLAEHRPGDAGADPATTDDQDEHAADTSAASAEADAS